MLTELCKEINNYFDKAKYFGEFTVTEGELADVDYLQDGQYFRIVGSVFNDGVYQYPATELKDEVFDGAIWAMAVPQEVIALAEEIDKWRAKYENEDAMSPYQSESFGGYSYTKASGSSGGTATWKDAFASQLNNYRRIKPF